MIGVRFVQGAFAIMIGLSLALLLIHYIIIKIVDAIFLQDIIQCRPSKSIMRCNPEDTKYILSECPSFKLVKRNAFRSEWDYIEKFDKDFVEECRNRHRERCGD